MCCHVPGESMNLQSIITAPCCSAYLRTSPGFMCCLSLVFRAPPRERARCGADALDGVLAGFAGADADDLVHRGHEDLPITDPSGPGGLGDRRDHLAHALL